jgi:hypothetical protein
MRRVDADQRQVPMRLGGVVGRHALEQLSGLREHRGRDARLQHRVERFVVRVDVGR